MENYAIKVRQASQEVILQEPCTITIKKKKKILGFSKNFESYIVFRPFGAKQMLIQLTKYRVMRPSVDIF